MTTDWHIDLSACQTRPLRSPGLLSRRAPKADTAPWAATLGPNAPHEGSRNPSCQLCALESNQRASENRFLIQSSHDPGCPKGRQRELLLGAPTLKAALALRRRNKTPPEQNLLFAVVEVVHCKRSLQDDLCKTILAGRSWHVIARPLVTGPEAKEPMAPRHRKARAVSIPRFARGAAVRRRAGEAGRGRDRRERALDHRYWNDRGGLCRQHSCGRAAVSDRQAEASHARLVCVGLDAIRRASRPRRALVHLPDNSPSCAV